MNLIRGSARGNGAPIVESNGCRLPLAGGSGAGDGQSVIYGIRPEHLDLAPDSADGGFPAEVAVVEPTGSETLAFLRFGETDIVAAFRDRHALEPGQTVTLRPRPDKAHVFDSESGMRL